MSDPQRQAYLGQQLTQATLQRRREEAENRRAEAVGRVNTLLETQKTIGDELAEGLGGLKKHSEELSQIRAAESETGLLASLTRPFTARRTALARRSVTEGLISLYERVSTRLREATAFSDELELTALELQREVDRLHRELGEALHNQRLAAQRILEAEAALDELGGLGLTPEEVARRHDRFTFDLRKESVSLELFKLAANQCRHHIEPARALRNTVLQLHEEMAQYVMTATFTVNAAGRRIQGLGMIADAPVVVAELQESLDELHQAMGATAQFVEVSQRLINDVLPDLAARLDADSESEALVLSAQLASVDRATAHRAAEEALRAAAEDEIEKYLGGE